MSMGKLLQVKETSVTLLWGALSFSCNAAILSNKTYPKAQALIGHGWTLRAWKEALLYMGLLMH